MRLGIFGGTVNPVHCAHLRMAVEAREALDLSRVEFVPAARPPHKSGGILDFEARCRLLEAALASCPGFALSRVEAGRPGPSYTVDTLADYARRHPDDELFFICGATDLVSLGLWHRGRELPRHAALAVLPRPGATRAEAEAFVPRFWPGAREERAGVWRLPEGGAVHLLDAPLLDISATLVRARLLAGQSLKCLVPPEVEEGLSALSPEALAPWRSEARA